MTDEQLFHITVGLDGGERSKYLDAACSDAEQKERVESLLLAHSAKDSLLDTESAAGSIEETYAQSNLPQSIGDFEILRELGRGGMGVVYEARQKSLKRKVALKVLSSGLGLSSKAILRFRREAEAAGKLHHTNIVPIYTTGEDKGIHYYAMEMVEGPSLDHVITELLSQRDNSGSSFDGLRITETDEGNPESTHRDDTYAHQSDEKRDNSTSIRSVSSAISTQSGNSYFDQVATMMAEVADALDHAHEHGVVHRDVKPSNLLRGPDGRLSINDFGLARMLEQPGMTVSGEFVGSPLYMSPEQITAGRVALDHRTDIYSLGATLYELLTLQPPFPGQSRDQVLSQILHKDAPSTRKLNRKIPIDLDTICMKAIDKDPDKRYQTAGKLAVDLRKYVNRHAISARRMGLLGRTFKLLRRNPIHTISSLAILTLITVLAVSYASNRNARRLDAEADAINSAMQGDEDGSKAKLQIAKSYGSRAAFEHTLLGQISLFNGKAFVANKQLQSAVKSDPNCVAAQSLLAVSYFLSGDEDEYILRQKDIWEMQTEEGSYQDQLFKGYALHWFSPHESVPLLRKAHQMHPTYISARYLKGQALTILALDTDNRQAALKLALEANEDIKAAYANWNDNAGARKRLIESELVLGTILTEMGRTAEAEKHFSASQELVDQILYELAIAEGDLETLFHHHDVVGKEDRFRDWLRANLDELRGAARITHGYAEVLIPPLFFGNAQTDELGLPYEIYSWAPEKIRMLTQYVPAFLATDDPARRRTDILADLQRKLDERLNSTSGVYLLLDWVALKMLKADEKTLTDVAQKVRLAYDSLFLGTHREHGLALADYMLDPAPLSEESLSTVLSATEASRGVSSYVHLIVATNFLAAGDRALAEVHLNKSVRQGYFMYYAPNWSSAFLRRVDDPTWLPWFPPKSDAHQEKLNDG